jgi:hypothetical protein
MPAQLSFIPGTMCDACVWSPVWRELGPQWFCDYLPIETELTREGMMDLIASAGSVGDPLNLVAFSMGGLSCSRVRAR